MANQLLNKELQQYVEHRIDEFDQIPESRKQDLEKVSEYIHSRINKAQTAKLVFICTHNSRRSHISQIWAQASTYYYDVNKIETYSGGTEATAFNPNAIKAIKETGMDVRVIKDGSNPLYDIIYAESADPIKAFSKIYDEDGNPTSDFAAIMTCSHADDNCPYIPGASLRIPITYDDPKEYDNTPQQDEAYKERTKQIAREMLYLLSKVN